MISGRFDSSPNPFMLGVVLVVPMEWLFYRTVEEPALKISRRLAGRTEERA
jgi:peptidoglycan/LPS O-acetylase OafA/YrhL